MLPPMAQQVRAPRLLAARYAVAVSALVCSWWLPSTVNPRRYSFGADFPASAFLTGAFFEAFLAGAFFWGSLALNDFEAAAAATVGAA